MEESTLRWPTDKEREEMEEVCSIGEVPHTEKSGVTNSVSFNNASLTNLLTNLRVAHNVTLVCNSSTAQNRRIVSK